VNVDENDELSSIGEPPAAEDERTRASHLAQALQKLEVGNTFSANDRNVFDSTGRTHRMVDMAEKLMYAGERLRYFASANTLPDQAVAAGLQTTLPNPFPDEFRIVGKLGEGAFGEVWLADDLNLGRQVAMKTLRYCDQGGQVVRAFESLRKEAQLLAGVRHPNIVQVHAWRQTERESYLVLQYVSGGSLQKRANDQGMIAWDQAARYIADVSEGLLKIHACGIVHRDIKPANILWDPQEDEALLTDFGVSARLADVRSLAGTPLYMPPEAFFARATAASDVYSLAASLFHLMTGDVPFQGANWDEQINLIEQGLANSDERWKHIPEQLEEVIRSGLAADEHRRPQLREFTVALRSALNQSLADSLILPTKAEVEPSSVSLRLSVSRIGDDGSCKPVEAAQRKVAGVSRDVKRVPRRPDHVALRTGDRVRIELIADHEGYVTVFNLGPTGNLNLLYPVDLATSRRTPDVTPNRPLVIVDDVEVTPPAGRERLFALWSRVPLTLRLDELVSLANQATATGSRAYHATRDMKRVQKSVNDLRSQDRQAVVLELDHLLKSS
jgi:serine/threonine protein kinase